MCGFVFLSIYVRVNCNLFYVYMYMDVSCVCVFVRAYVCVKFVISMCNGSRMCV